MSTTPLTIDCGAADGVRVKPRIGVFVDDQSPEQTPPGPSGTFKKAGCCVLGATPPALDREENTDDTCIDINDCDNPAVSVSAGVPVTQPGNQSASNFTFSTAYTPGSALIQWYEAAQKSGLNYVWRLCYTNAAKQEFTAWVKSITPQAFDANTGSVTAEVVISLTTDWTWS